MGHLNEVLRMLTADDPKTAVQGRRFERLVQAALRAHPGEYGRERFAEVWLWSEWPDRVERGYGADIGIDIVARQTPAYGGGLCAVQCKFYGREVPTGGVDKFLAASGTADFASRLLVVTAPVSKTGDDKIRKADPRCEVLSTSEMDHWVDDWREFVDTPDRLEIPPAPKHDLYPFQREAVDRIVEGFDKADRGQLILPCGTGKSLVALRAAERVAGQGGRVLYLVPSIALIGQTMREWSRQREIPLRYLGVCSDPTVGRRASVKTDIVADLTELAIPVTTDPGKLAEELAKEVSDDAMQVVFSTYQSSLQIADAQEEAGGYASDFNLIICDEAHRTTGIEESSEGMGNSPFRVVHDNGKVRGLKRLYMTATPRVFTAQQRKRIDESPDFEGDSYSMDDPEKYGERFYEMEFSEAVDGGYLTDYEVLVIAASQEAYLQSLTEAGVSHEMLEHDNKQLALSDAVKLAGCWDALATPSTTEVLVGRPPGQIFAEGGDPARTAISFTNRVDTSKLVANIWPQVAEALTQKEKGHQPNGERDSEFLQLEVSHIDGKTPAAIRANQLQRLRSHTIVGGERPVCRIISNARVLTEGVDVPSLDAVIFVHQRYSPVDITQAVGRAMRKAPGKKKGYIVIPVVVPEGVSAQEMLEASDFKTVWEVVRALRSHDSRMEYYINTRSAWLKNAPLIFRQSSLGQNTEVNDIDVGFQQRLALQLSQEIASQVVDTIGDKQMFPRWGARAADICRQVQIRVKQLVTVGGAEQAFERFLKGIRNSIGDHITCEQAQEMIAQHVVTIPVFEVMLAGSGFAEQNPVSQEIEHLLGTFRELGASFEEELRPLTRAYRQMEAAFEGAVTSAEKVDILREIYDGFFKAAMKDIVKRVGIVYTPVQIVDFMVRSAAAICQKEFGRSIGSENLHILDPFAGTGSYLARLIEMKDEDGNYLISPEDLERKYKEELHANELILLAYYIAAIKIEEAKHSRDIESDGTTNYERYRKILLTDTFLESPSQVAFPAFQDNIRGRLEQDATPMTVILANPPWSSGQKDAGDDNPNLEYEDVGNRVEQTYGVKHREVTGRAPGGNASGNLYVKAIRWCSDRVLPNAQRGDYPAVIGLVHPNSLTDATSLAGLRATLRDEFTDIYVINLLGNAFKQGDERKREGDPVFGEGTRNGTQITFLVRNPSKNPIQPATLYYAQVPDYMRISDKWKWLNQVWDMTSVQLTEVPLIPRHDWKNLSDGTFEEMLTVCDTNTSNTTVAFLKHASGVKTNCDDYVYSFSREGLIEKVVRLIDAYEEALDWYEDDPQRDVLEKATENNKLDEIKWTNTLKASLKRRKNIVFDENRIREVLYRPFTKLWLYEDDRILSAVKTVSAMFPRDAGVESYAVTGGSNNSSPESLTASDVLPDLNSVGPGRGGGVSSSDGDSDQQWEQHDLSGAGIDEAYGPGGDQGFPADSGDTAPRVTGGGDRRSSSPPPPTRRSSELSRRGSSATSAQSEPFNRLGLSPDSDPDDRAVQHGDLRGAGSAPVAGSAYDGGRSADSDDSAPRVTGGGGSAILVNQTQQLPFTTLATGILFDLCATGRQTRALPRRS